MSIRHVCSSSPVFPLVLVSPIPVPRLVLLFLVVFRQELSLWVRDREVSKDIRGWVGLLLEITVCHSSLTGEPLCGVHDQQFLQQLESLRVWFDPVPVHVLQQGAVHIRGALKVLQQCWVLWHPPHVFPVLLLGEAHHVKDPVQLVMVIRVACLDVLLPTMEDWFTGKKFSKDTTDCPNVNRLRIMTCPQE